ncbi:hypothetical protein ACYVVI_01005 [Arenicellales bacterium IMCC57338]
MLPKTPLTHGSPIGASLLFAFLFLGALSPIDVTEAQNSDAATQDSKNIPVETVSTDTDHSQNQVNESVQPQPAVAPPLIIDTEGATKANVNPNDSASYLPWVWIIVSGFFFTLSLALIGLVIWGYLRNNRLRKIIGESSENLGESYVAIVPEEWHNTLLKQDKLFTDYREKQDNLFTTHHEKMDQVVGSFKALEEQTVQLKKSVDDMKEAHRILQDKLQEKDEEINRLKDGYDFYLFKNHIGSFIETNEKLNEFINNQNFSEKALGNTAVLLGQALEDAGIETFEPEVGTAYSSNECADRPDYLSTTEPAAHRTIAEIVKPGYRREDGQVIIKAAVKVFTFKEEE